MTLGRVARLLVAFAGANAVGCTSEPVGELVRIQGRGPRDMDQVTLRAMQPDGTTSGIRSWDIGIEAGGHFDLTTHVDPSSCDRLVVRGYWCLCGILGDGVYHSTQLHELGRCGEHVDLVLVE